MAMVARPKLIVIATVLLVVIWNIFMCHPIAHLHIFNSYRAVKLLVLNPTYKRLTLLGNRISIVMEVLIIKQE